MAEAKLQSPIFPSGPLEVVLTAVFACHLGRKRKGSPAERRWKATRPDIENIAKAALDAGTGVLWHDDGQVVVLTIYKLEGAQDEKPFVRLAVVSMSDSDIVPPASVL